MCNLCNCKSRAKENNSSLNRMWQEYFYNKKVYSDLSFVYGPNKKRAYKYVWHLKVDSPTGYGNIGLFKAKASLLSQHARNYKNGRVLEKKLKVLDRRMLEKINLVNKGQEVWIGNSSSQITLATTVALVLECSTPKLVELSNQEIFNGSIGCTTTTVSFDQPSHKLLYIDLTNQTN